MPSPKKPKTAYVDLTVTKLAAPTAQWPQGYQFDLSGSYVNSSGQLKFKNSKHPGFIVVFYIVEADPLNPTNCQFLPNPNDALWTRPFNAWDPAPPCPSSPCQWDQFRAIDVADDEEDPNDPTKDLSNKVLVVMNKNDYKQQFAFTLRFRVKGSEEVIVFDPIGNNQNGGQ